jgi:hypothetical protein
VREFGAGNQLAVPEQLDNALANGFSATKKAPDYRPELFCHT